MRREPFWNIVTMRLYAPKSEALKDNGSATDHEDSRDSGLDGEQEKQRQQSVRFSVGRRLRSRHLRMRLIRSPASRSGDGLTTGYVRYYK